MEVEVGRGSTDEPDRALFCGLPDRATRVRQEFPDRQIRRIGGYKAHSLILLLPETDR